MFPPACSVDRMELYKGCLRNWEWVAWCGMRIALGGGFPWHGKILQHYLKLVCVQRKTIAQVCPVQDLPALTQQ